MRAVFDVQLLTVVALSNPVLNPPPFSEVRDLCPVLVRLSTGTESTASMVGDPIPGGGAIGVRRGSAVVHGWVLSLCFEKGKVLRGDIGGDEAKRKAVEWRERTRCCEEPWDEAA